MKRILAIITVMIMAVAFCMADDCDTTTGGSKCQTAEDCPTIECQFPSCNLKTGTCEC